MTSIYNVMMEKFVGQDTIIPEIGKILTNPIPTMIAVIQALISAMSFAGNMGAHGYFECVDKTVEYLDKRAASIPP